MGKSHRDLDAWQKSMSLVSEVYALTRKFPHEELYGLTSQIRRAAVSVPSNLAEGAGRGSKQEFIRFINIALGSLSELETQLLIALNLGYVDKLDGILEKVISIRQMMKGLVKRSQPA